MAVVSSRFVCILASVYLHCQLFQVKLRRWRKNRNIPTKARSLRKDAERIDALEAQVSWLQGRVEVVNEHLLQTMDLVRSALALVARLHLAQEQQMLVAQVVRQI